jgi:CHAD domain-containing protein
VDHKVNVLPAKDSDAHSARRGIKRTYKAGRKAFAKARKHPRTPLLHEWRKQTKYLANELELARLLFELKQKRRCKRAGKLGSVLGDDHDLALLRAKLRELNGTSRASRQIAQSKRLEQRIERKRRRLQAKAHRLGARLYGKAASKYASALASDLGR